MPAPVVVEFLLKGMPAIERAMQSVEQAATKAERSRTTAGQRGSKERVSTEEKEARAKERLIQKTAREQEKAQQRASREAQKAAKDREKAADREMRGLVRAAEQSANARLRAEREVAREVEKLERQKARAHAQRERENARITREAARDQEKIHREQTRMLEQRAKDKAAARERFNRGAGGALARGASAGLSTAGRAAQAAAGTFAELGGGFSISDAVQREVGLHRVAGTIAASTITPEGQKPIATQDIVSRVRAIGIQNAVDPEDVAKAVGKFKDLTGDTAKALEMMPELAKLATAFGVNLDELAENAGNIKMALGDDATNADVMKVLRVQTRQGGIGAVEMKDLAKFGGRLAAGSGLFEGDRKKNIISLSSFAQVARQYGGATTAAEATLAAQRFATDLQNKAGFFKSMGIDVKGANGAMRDPNELLIEAIRKTGGDVTKLGNLGAEDKGQAFGERGVRVMTGMADIYRKAGGGKKGEEAIRAKMAEFGKDISQGEIDQRAATRLQDADKKLEQAMIELRGAVGSQLLPEFIKLVPVLKEAIPYITKFMQKMVDLAKWAEENPFKGLAAILMVAMGKEVAAAGIGKATAAALSTSIGASAGVIGAAAAVAIAAGIAAMEAEFAAIDQARNKSIGTSSAVFAEAKGIEGRIQRGEQTSGDVERLKVLKASMGQQVEQERANVNKKGWTEAIVGGAGGLVSKDVEEANKQSQKDREERLRQSQQALDELDKAMTLMLKRQAANAKNVEGGGKPGAGGGKPDGKPPAASTGIVQRAVK